MAEALRRHGVTDPKAVIAAADAAVLVLGKDRCICRRDVHAQHHHSPVDRCPWCHPAAVPKARKRKSGTDTVPTQGLL
jgi:hypothetical protein